MTQPIHPMLFAMAERMAVQANVPADIGWRMYVGLARAAIQALMEPDEGKINAIGEAASRHVYGLSGSTEIYLAGLRPLVEGEE